MGHHVGLITHFMCAVYSQSRFSEAEGFGLYMYITHSQIRGTNRNLRFCLLLYDHDLVSFAPEDGK